MFAWGKLLQTLTTLDAFDYMWHTDGLALLGPLGLSLAILILHDPVLGSFIQEQMGQSSPTCWLLRPLGWRRGVLCLRKSLVVLKGLSLA